MRGGGDAETGPAPRRVQGRERPTTTLGPVPHTPDLGIGTLNLASGRGAAGRVHTAAELDAVLRTGLPELDLLAVQEVDAGQPRSHGADQAAVVAEALGAVDWRMAVTLTGTPGPRGCWQPADPPTLRGRDGAPGGPCYGIALISRLPVRRWSVLPLDAGGGRLPVRAHDPRTGRSRVRWIPDEPRAALAAELDGGTVVATHLSFAPHTAVRQLRRLRRWVATLPAPVVLAGDLNLPGALPARLLGGTGLVRAPTFPADEPRVQLDHLLALGPGLTVRDGAAVRLGVGDHRLLAVRLALG